ncbi:MAG: group II intron maturase-specific domain-containing protein, partial [Verrucomicrobiota bacterium]
LDFLGYTFRHDRDQYGRPQRYWNLEPSRQAMEREREALRHLIGPHQSHTPMPELIGRVNRHLRGWTKYFKLGYPRKAFRQLSPLSSTGSIDLFRFRSSMPTSLFLRGGRHSGSRMARSCWIVALLLLNAASAKAEVPTLEYLFPGGGQLGTRASVSAGGKLDPWPVQAWTDSTGLVFKATAAKGQFEVQIAGDVSVGPHLVRVYTADGASAPRCFLVGTLPEQVEKPPCDDPGQPELIGKLPVTVNGRLAKKGETDSFFIKLEAGQLLVASVVAYRLDYPLDCSLRLLDGEGKELAANDDSHSLDPMLSHPIGQAGTYLLQLSAATDPSKTDARLSGSEAAVYRLTMTSEALPPDAVPTLGKPGADSPDESMVLWSALQTARPVLLPFSIDGQINPAGDEDRFRFSAGQNERFYFRVQSGTLSSPLEALLSVRDQYGNVLAQTESNGAQDAELTWTAAAEGSYTFTITDQARKGGIEYVYHLDMGNLLPDFQVTASNHAFRLKPGTTNEMIVTVLRPDGYESSMSLVLEGLPASVDANADPVPAKGGDVKVRLMARPEAKPANQPFRVLAIVTDPAAPQVRLATAILKGQYAAPTDLLTNQTDQLWLTVLPQPKPDR